MEVVNVVLGAADHLRRGDALLAAGAFGAVPPAGSGGHEAEIREEIWGQREEEDCEERGLRRIFVFKNNNKKKNMFFGGFHNYIS